MRIAIVALQQDTDYCFHCHCEFLEAGTCGNCFRTLTPSICFRIESFSEAHLPALGMWDIWYERRDVE